MAHPATVTRHTLDNGLRVVLADHPGAHGAAVSVHYGVGFRSERPGEAGLAHLFEHLMTQDSHRPMPAAKLNAALGLGGTAGATTHPDHTDYFQWVPGFALDAVLHWEADRMRRPRFTAAGLRAQLVGVAAEITRHRDTRGGLPWPVLPGVLFSAHANAHDGYGDVTALAGTTLQDCHAFFAAHYAPGNAVLTVRTDLSAAHAEGLTARLAHHFADVPARAHRPRPDLSEPHPDADRLRYLDAAGEGPDTAVLGYRLPDPVTERRAYLAHMVLAEALRAPLPGAEASGRPPADSAACGYFAPLAARDPDTLILVGRDAEGAGGRVSDRVDTALDAIADGAAAPALLASARRAAFHHTRALSCPVEVCRALGRFELLYGDAGQALDVGRRLAAVTPDEVAAAAAGLRRAHRAVLTVHHRAPKSAVRTGTTPSPGQESGPGAGPAHGHRREPSCDPGDSFVHLPWTATDPAPQSLDVVEHTPRQGLRVVAARHRDARATEVRLRVDVPHARHGHRVRLATALRAPVDPNGLRCAPRAVVRGTAVEISAALPRAALATWLDRLGSVLAAFAAAAAADPPPLPDVGDHALEHYLRSPGNAPAPWDGPDLDLVCVGDADPEEVAAAVDGSWAHLPTGPSKRTPAPPEPAPGSVLVHAPSATAPATAPSTAAAAGTGRLALWAPLPERVPDPPALHLALALANGAASFRHGEVRGAAAAPVALTGRPDPRGVSPAGTFTGVETVAGRPAVFLAAVFPADRGRTALDHLCRELGPPPGTAPETGTGDRAAACDLLGGRLTLAFDDPAGLADLLASWTGVPPADLPALPGHLREVGPADLARVRRELWCGGGFSGAVSTEDDAVALGRLTSNLIPLAQKGTHDSGTHADRALGGPRAGR